jgi:phosphatidate cytidylyltransferase
MLRTRLLTAAVLAPLVLLFVLLGEPWLAIILGVIAFLALAEVISLLDAGGFEPPQVLTLLAGLAVVAAGLLAANTTNVGGLLAELVSTTTPPGLVAVTYIGAVLLLGAAAFTRADPRTGFLTWSVSAFGVAYIGLLLPAIAFVGHVAPEGGSATTPVGAAGIGSGPAWLLLLVLTVWGYDTGAYVTGRWLGRRSLIDHISPAKTVEGLAGGLILGTAGAGIGAILIGLEPWHPLVLGPLLGLAAQAGDIAESMLKRAAGRKDSGFVMPGHGGILDRVDSFLFAAPVLAGYAMLVAGRVL